VCTRGSDGALLRGPSTSPLERMRLRSLPSRKLSPPQQLGVSYDHVVVNHGMLAWLHLILGLAAALAYLSTFDTTHFRWWRRSAGMVVLMHSSGSLLPYLVSGLFSRRLVMARRIGVWLFALVLMGGTAAVGYFYLTRSLDDDEFIYRMAAVVLAQTAVYVLAARGLLGGSADE
jgi:hypothetical protein